MDTQKYNGWANYATWLCNLWFDDFDFSDDIEGLSECCDSKMDLLPLIEDIIELYVEAYMDSAIDEQHGFVSDLIQCAYENIDFRDIAEHYVDDVMDDIETHRRNQLLSTIQSCRKEAPAVS